MFRETFASKFLLNNINLNDTPEKLNENFYELSKYVGLDKDYDKTFDKIAAILICNYKDKSILPAVANAIFLRHRKGLFTHNLIWAFFEAKDPSSLSLIGNKLQSSNLKDVELAEELLSFIPEISNYRNTDNLNKYLHFTNWIEDNGLFLKYTGESFQLTTTPCPYTIIYPAKYICKKVSVDTGNPITPLTRYELRLLDEFNKLNDDFQKLLSSFSHAVYRQNLYFWSTWIHSPIKSQIRSARMGGIYYD